MTIMDLAVARALEASCLHTGGRTATDFLELFLTYPLASLHR